MNTNVKTMYVKSLKVVLNKTSYNVNKNKSVHILNHSATKKNVFQ